MASAGGNKRNKERMTVEEVGRQHDGLEFRDVENKIGLKRIC